MTKQDSSKTEHTEAMEERLDRLANPRNGSYGQKGTSTELALKTFIRQELQRQKEEIVEGLEKARKDDCDGARIWHSGYNEALQDAINFINNLNQD